MRGFKSFSLCTSLLYRLVSRLSRMSRTQWRYALRADVDESFRKRISDWCSKVADGFIVAYEVEGENRHIHAILDSSKEIKKLRSDFTRSFPECVGNKGYSLKECDDNYDAYIRYICKGVNKDIGPVIWCHQGLMYGRSEIDEAHQKYWVNNESLVENAKKRAKVEKESIVDQVEKLAKAKGLKGFDRVGVANIYINLFRDARKGINVFAARAVVNTVCCLLEGSGQEELAHKIAEL